MLNSANDTLLLNEPGVRRDATCTARDYTDDLNRIIRHALKDRNSSLSLDRAIRSAARATSPAAIGRTSDVGDIQARSLASRLNTLLARRAVDEASDPHRQTVRA